MQFYEWKSLIISKLAKFGGHRHCGSGDIDIPANTIILPQARDIRDYIYLQHYYIL